MGCANTKTAVEQPPVAPTVVATDPQKGDDLLNVAPAAAYPTKGPHQGKSTEQPTTPQVVDSISALFGGKHAILSYQWDVQEHVVAVRELLKKRGIPTWMDIDGCDALLERVELTKITNTFR